MTTVTVEWGRQIDCAAEGCDPVHVDNGYVFSELGEPDRSIPARVKSHEVNSHAARWVRRTITVSPWEAE